VRRFSRLSREALLLGRIDHSGRRRWIREPADALPGADEAVIFDGGQAPHLLTIAPGPSGRDRSCLIPNLLNYAGQAVVLDIDGTAYAATAQARRAMGQLVVRLDPFGVTGPGSARYSPIDWVEPPDEAGLTAGSQEIADLLFPGNAFSDEDQEAADLLGAIVGYLLAVPEKQSDDIYRTLHGEDVIYSLAVVLDTIGRKILPRSYTTIARFLEKDDRVRARILARATAAVESLAGPEVQASVHESTFRFPPETPATVYVILPAGQLALHAGLARLWIGTFLRRAASAASAEGTEGTAGTAGQPPVPMLFLLDHCAELGAIPLLESLHATAPAGSPRIWTFWDDVHQLRATYPRGWAAMIAGCGAVQAFGSSDPEGAAEAAAVLGLPADDVLTLGPGDQIVRLDGVPRRVRRLGPGTPGQPARAGERAGE
jgi:type IV secretion system protein VirD4